MSERREVRLGDVADVNWGDTKTTKASYVESGFRAFSASGPDGWLPWADYDRVGIVVSAIGAECGKTWLAKGRWSCIKNTIRFFSSDPTIDTEFLYWATRDPNIWPRRGSAQPFISQGDARNIRLEVPPLAEQRAIAGVLGALDDKIESNRRTGCLALELLTSTWLRYAADAPVGRVGDLVTLSAERVGVRSAEVTVLSATSAGLLVPSNEFFEKQVYSKDISKYLLVRPWAFAYNPSRANIGSIGLNVAPALGAVSPVYVVAQTSGPAPAWWLEVALRTPQVRNDIGAFSSGSVRQVLRFEDLASIELPLPNTEAMDSFFFDVEPLIQLRARLVGGSRALGDLRDALLPELLSGRLRVREAEEMAGSV